MILVSMSHDLGKADRNFQNYIRNVTKKLIAAFCNVNIVVCYYLLF